jgi:hypothetical protein
MENQFSTLTYWAFRSLMDLLDDVDDTWSAVNKCCFAETLEMSKTLTEWPNICWQTPAKLDSGNQVRSVRRISHMLWLEKTLRLGSSSAGNGISFALICLIPMDA